jgi:hypothetical protein
MTYYGINSISTGPNLFKMGMKATFCNEDNEHFGYIDIGNVQNVIEN